MPTGYDGLPPMYIGKGIPLTPNLGMSLIGMDPVVAENFWLIDVFAAGPFGGTPAAPLNSVQFNNGGAFGGISQMTFDGSVTLSMDTLIVQTHRNTIAAGYDAYVHSPGVLVRGGAFNCYKSQGTKALPTAVLNGDALGYFSVNGYDGSTYAGVGNGGSSTGCYFQCTATENWSTTNHGCKWQFFATPNTTTTAQIALEIGELGAGVAAQVKTPASAPTDGNLNTGSISFYLDQVGNNLKVRVKYNDGVTFKTATIALV